MSRLACLVILFAIAAHVCGCGGSNGNTNNNSQVTTVEIQDVRFFQKNITINAGDRVTWVNTDNAVHQIVSGTLAATSTPVVRTPIISINENNTFTPDVFEANLGDTVQWRNNRMTGAFLLDIVNDAGVPVVTLSFVRTGQVIGLSSFPGAGFYLYTQQNNPNFRGSLFIFGRPVPDGNFSSRPLAKGGSFTTQFPSPGTFPYFDLDQDDPDRSFMTGAITVQ